MAQTGSTGRFRVGSLLMKGGVEISTGAGAPTDGVAGTGSGKSGPGSLYIDITNKKLYQNTNTQASPTWASLGDIVASEIALADGKLLVGGATGVAAAKTPSGDVTFTNEGVTAISAGVIVDADINAAAAIALSKLANGAALSAVVAAGLANAASYPSTDAATNTLVAANASKDRGVLVMLVVTETYATNGGTQPTVKVGEDTQTELGIAAATVADKTSGTILCAGFLNTSTRKVIVTTTAGDGALGTGACTVIAIALPNS